MLDIEMIVFSRIKAILTSKLNTKYPDIFFTTSDKVSTDPQFPNVYVHLLGSPEIGSDLDNTTIIGVEATLQIEVTDNQSQTRTKEVIDAVVAVMKGMRFSIVAMPEFNNTDSAYRSVARFRRIIGNLDVF